MKIKLYHYSNIEIKDKLKVKYFGDNYFTLKDKKCSEIERLFFYTEQETEFLLSNCKYKYTAIIDSLKLYDLTTDKLNLKNKYSRINDLLYYIKKRYSGCIYNIGYNVVVLFKDIKYSQKEVLEYSSSKIIAKKPLEVQKITS